MKLPSDRELDLWIKYNKNILLRGEKGTGKTTVLKSAFERNFGKMNEDWVYFSAATLDPFIDLIGIPKEKVINGESFIHLVRPEYFQKGAQIKGFIIDEINRCPPKVSNALLEILQFKSVNGAIFPNVRVICGAANPYDDEARYTVEKMDEALEDRFQIIIEVDYELNEDYFFEKYPTTAKAAIEWWKALPKEGKRLVSPRRLDYALESHGQNINLRHILNEKTLVSKLIDGIKLGSIEERLSMMFKDAGTLAFRKAIEKAGFLEDALKYIKHKREWVEKFIPVIAEKNLEFVAKILDSSNVDLLIELSVKSKPIEIALKEIRKSGMQDKSFQNVFDNRMERLYPTEVQTNDAGETFSSSGGGPTTSRSRQPVQVPMLNLGQAIGGGFSTGMLPPTPPAEEPDFIRI